ncbi:MAG: tRNA lysidine(34) synthetase TilS [Thermoguttaceae bacterium]|jgi:tRNA(Ile)-lysidine synthase
MFRHRVETRLAFSWPPPDWREVTVLLAVSGGGDSVALLRAMAALKTGGRGRLRVAHANHQLRGGESDADETLVVELCRRLDMPCEVKHLPIDRVACRGLGLEAVARRARYAFLQDAAGRSGARYVVTAHTADDQAETILHRILRGTGIRGLAGMARARPLGPATLLRPLLGIRRADLLRYLDDLGQPYRRDSSNRDLRFTRNRIRHELLPRLAERFNPSVAEALVRLGSLAGEAQAALDRWAADLVDRHVRPAGGTVVLDRAGLACQPRYVVGELMMAIWRRQGWPMQAMGLEEWDLLAAMLLPRPGPPTETAWKHVFPGGVEAEITESGMRLARR